MKKLAALILSLFLLFSLFLIMSCKKVEKPVEPPRSVASGTKQENIGEELFNEHCIMCHPEGSKIEHIREPADIAKVIRNPKGSMPEFNEDKISDQDATLLSKFIFLSIISHK